MDSNGSSSWPLNGLPVGFGMALAMNQDALERYSKLTEAEREQVIARSHNAKSKTEMQQIIDSFM